MDDINIPSSAFQYDGVAPKLLSFAPGVHRSVFRGPQSSDSSQVSAIVVRFCGSERLRRKGGFVHSLDVWGWSERRKAEHLPILGVSLGESQRICELRGLRTDHGCAAVNGLESFVNWE
jgi:hypothetical protein